MLKDVWGNSIRLTEERRAHLIEHPEMQGQEDKVTETLLEPDIVIQSQSDDAVRLCGYKGGPELWVCRDDVPENIELDEDVCADSSDSGEVKIGDKTWEYSFETYDSNMVNLKLIEPDGTEWTATCGYLYGAGHMED